MARRTAPLALLISTAALVAFVIPGSLQNARAQNAPGSDPIVIPGTVAFSGLPMRAPDPSKPLDKGMELPSWLQAKIVRLEAKAYAGLAGGDGTIYTEQDVVSRQTGNALEKNCTTNVASNVGAPVSGGPVSPSGAPIGPNPTASGPAGRYGVGSAADQIAVVRGNLVTICK